MIVHENASVSVLGITGQEKSASTNSNPFGSFSGEGLLEHAMKKQSAKEKRMNLTILQPHTLDGRYFSLRR